MQISTNRFIQSILFRNARQFIIESLIIVIWFTFYYYFLLFLNAFAML